MKTYKEVVALLGERVFGKYMGGSNNIYYDMDTSIIGFIYNKLPHEVLDDITLEFQRLSHKYYTTK